MLSIQVKLIGIFALLLHGRKAVSLEVQDGTSVIQGIREVADLGGGDLQKVLLDQRGELNAEIVILLNNTLVPPSELSQTTLSGDDTLTIIPMVAGG